ARARWFPGFFPTWGFSHSTSGERVVRLVLRRGHGGRLRLALDGARDGFLDCAIVEVLDLLVVLGFPMDEYTDGDKQIVGLVRGDHGLGNGILRRTKHLHRLARILDGHLVVEDRWRLG